MTSGGELLEPSPPKSTEPGRAHRLVMCPGKWHTPKPPPLYPYHLPRPKVVIVGAGLAGLAAGSRLAQAGIRNVVIVEAIGRPGGRVHTCRLKKTPVDLGGNDLYGCSITNPLYNLAVIEGLINNTIEKRTLKGPYFNADGLIVYDIEKPYKMFTFAIEEAARLFGCKKEEKMSMKCFLKKKLNSSLINIEKDCLEEVTSVINGLENESRIRWGDDLNNVSADHFGAYRELHQSILKLHGIGASTLLQPYLRAVEKNIRYCKPVQSIRWDPGRLEAQERCGVLCCDGDEFNGDFVICTVPLGVLKTIGASLFSPALPACKKTAIANLSVGMVNNIFLEYRKPFWPPSEGVIKIGWSPEEMSSRDSWLKGIGAFEEVSPTVLKTSVAGREAVWCESLSDCSLAEDITTFLRQVTGNPSIPCPSNIVRSRWCSDVFFQGAQSYLGLRSSPADLCELARPLPSADHPVVLFAGEATAVGLHSTFQGAVASGLREADRIIAACKLRWPLVQKESDVFIKCENSSARNP